MIAVLLSLVEAIISEKSSNATSISTENEKDPKHDREHTADTDKLSDQDAKESSSNEAGAEEPLNRAALVKKLRIQVSIPISCFPLRPVALVVPDRLSRWAVFGVHVL